MANSISYELLTSNGYTIPTWCWMPLDEHLYCGGCWGISQGCVAEKGQKHCEPCEYYVTAAKLLCSDHPMHNSFLDWCREKGSEPSKRQGAKFLQEKRDGRFAE